jgi:hypothetical protein
VRRRQQTDPDGPQLHPLNGRLPVMPLRTIGVRLVDGRWSPCHERDPRGTLRLTVDGAGRTVQWAGDPWDPDGRDGWQLSPGPPPLPPATVLDWLEQERRRRRRKGRTDG